MYCLFPKIFSTRRTFSVLCICTLAITIWFGSLSHPSRVTAKANDVQQLVQIGVDYYESGDFLAAVEPWLTAYTVYEAAQDPVALAIVSENLARAYQQLGQTSTEISYWERAITEMQTSGSRSKLGRLMTEQAQAYSRLGQQRRAIAILCGATPLSENVASENVFTVNAGDTANVETTACVSGSAVQLAQESADTIGQITALGSLGEAYRLSGDAQQALALFELGLEISRTAKEASFEGVLLTSLGNTSVGLSQVSYRRANEAGARGDRDANRFRLAADKLNARAIDYFQASYALAMQQQSTTEQLRALLNLISAYERAEEPSAAKRSWALASGLLAQLPDSQMKAFAAIKLSDYLEPLAIRSLPVLLNGTPPISAIEAESAALLEKAIDIGESIQNSRVLSFALGKKGNLEERAGRYDSALAITQEARLFADQDLAAQDSLYLLEWQMGRILKAQGNWTDADQAYRQAVDLLNQIRGDILNANQSFQFDFRDTVEPIYRQYAALNLKEVPTEVTLRIGEAAFDELDTTLTALDSLKVAELQSYFANDCVIVPVDTRVDAVGDSRATAVLSTAILETDEPQIVVIASLPDGSKKVVRTPIDSQAVKQTIKDFRDTLELGGSQYISEYNYAPSEQLYDWLIKPFETDFSDVKTLVFVNDGLLRSVPMAALYDGKQYLIEQFAVATTPSLTLTDPQRISRPTALSALLMGVSERPKVAGQPFTGLPAVEKELATVAKILPDSQVLLNKDFSISALRTALAQKNYRILHMATHGTFGFDPADNYIVAGAKQAQSDTQVNETLTISELDSLIREVSDPTREPIELLTLTACETAIGDNRSTLGLAGVAIRAGVRSAIATLWSVSDESSAELIAQFYDSLKTPELTKAEALQAAQVAMIQSDNFVDRHPYRWAPFTLIGNWL